MSKLDYPIAFAPRQTAVASFKPLTPIGPGASATVYRKIGKPALDIVFTLLLMPVILPVIAVLALLIARDGAQPFYGQNRIGRDGRVFRMWKLRTMVPDAEAKLDAHLAQSKDARTEWEVKQKLHDDPRTTAIGRMLRRTSLDELPQFFNVLLGDMSVVGPRPMMEGQEDLYSGQGYYTVRPGVTGPWQVSDRNASSFADRAQFDDFYVKSMSASRDLQLIKSTVSVVMRGTGC